MRINLLRFTTLLLSTLSLAFVVTTTSLADVSISNGERIYKEGILPSGGFIPATIHGDIKVTGDQVICSSCHRKSGMGSSEGQQVIPAIAGNILFEPLRLPTSKPPAPPELRPAYDKATLKRALTQGIDANGELLDPFMPRYEISDDQLDSLIQYLNTLSAKPDPGVDDKEIHFATIVIGDETSPRNKAMIDVFEAYIQQKNAETRHESFRAANAPWHKEWMMKTYRKWNYHLWTLEGGSDTWRDQLNDYYEKQPVFSVINGVVDDSFAPIHSFCEERGVPCLLPTTLLPTLDEDDFYTVYLNRGYIFEGEALASYLNKEHFGKSVINIVDSKNSQALHASFGLRVNLKTGEYEQLEYDCKGGSHSTLDLAKIEKYQIITLNTDRQCSNQILETFAQSASKSNIFLSSRLFGSDIEDLPSQLKPRLRFTQTYELPSRINRLLARSTGWFKHKRILDPEQMEVQANAYLALKVAGDALKHIRGYFFRDYFIEKIEHNIDDAPYTSVYPRISLAPGQRFISRGFYMAKIDEERGRLSAITEWRAP